MSHLHGKNKKTSIQHFGTCLLTFLRQNDRRHLQPYLLTRGGGAVEIVGATTCGPGAAGYPDSQAVVAGGE